MFIKLEKGKFQPYTLAQFAKDHPSLSISGNPTRAFLSMYNVYELKKTRKPEYDANTHRLVVVGYAPDAGYLREKFEVRPLAASTASRNQRRKRDQLLSATDWRFRSDLTPSQEWVDYCQALRDVPAQQGFPYAVEWPTKPE
jgi:hypothetical protein